MEIYISKQKNNSFAFFYKQDGLFFIHKIEIPAKFQVIDNELLRFAIINSPLEFKTSVRVIGVSASSSLITNLSNIFKIDILCSVNDEFSNPQHRQKVGSDPIFLGFSGGFDSMAAKAILPKDQLQCVSIDFGGNFQRESEFFKTLDTDIIKWDIRNERLNSLRKFNESQNWRFMLSPLCLLRENGSNIVISTGTILEAAPFWMNPDKRNELKSYSDFGYGIGVSLINPVSGISEYGTTKIVYQTYSEKMVMSSLYSLASPSSFKFYRKKCLLAAVQNNPNLISKKDLVKKHSLGQSFADDLICLYFCWKFGVDWAKEFFADNIPDNLKLHDMAFFEKLNVNNLNIIDPELREYLIKKILSYGIEAYSEEDYLNLGLVGKQLMSKNFI